MKSIVDEMKEYVSEHLQQPLTLSDIASHIGYSKFHTSRVFKAETGMSLFEYIRRERLTASAHALRNG